MKETGFLTKSIEKGGRQIKYVVYIPPAYDMNKATPAIIFLNGMGECGTDGLKQLAVGLGTAVMRNVEDWPFIIIFPQKQDAHADWGDEDAMVTAVLKKTQREYKIDKSRLYLTGISQGGRGTWAIAAKHPKLFAAIVPICGWGDEDMAKKLVRMPVWIFHGDADSVIKVEESLKMAEYLKAGGLCKLTIYPGVDHNSWDKAYNEEKLYDWFLERRR